MPIYPGESTSLCQMWPDGMWVDAMWTDEQWPYCTYIALPFSDGCIVSLCCTDLVNFVDVTVDLDNLAVYSTDFDTLTQYALDLDNTALIPIDLKNVYVFSGGLCGPGGNCNVC